MLIYPHAHPLFFSDWTKNNSATKHASIKIPIRERKFESIPYEKYDTMKSDQFDIMEIRKS